MAKEIKSKIIGYEVVKPEQPAAEPVQPESNVVQMHESVERPEMLLGSTYKIKTPLSDHALYITINDIILNEGTEHEQRRPFEIFINSKNMEHYQWIVALTRLMSAVFRKGGDSTFLVEELKAVFDPQGGYFQGGSFVPSIVADIGNVIERHLRDLGLIEGDGLDEHQRAYLEEKRLASAEAEMKEDRGDGSGYPASATLCPSCHTRAVVVMDGCRTCLACGASKCG